MDELVPDDEYFEKICIEMRQFLKSIEHDLYILKDKEADIFSRYIAYSKALHVLNTMDYASKSFAALTAVGHFINHPKFQTEKAIIRGWGKIEIEDCSFFKSPEKDESEFCSAEKSSPEWVKKMLKEISQ